MAQKGHTNKAPKYSSFVFFSAGPVGDHALIIDHANRFYESSGLSSTILMKHPNRFLLDMSIPYCDHISTVGFSGWSGKLKTALFALSSVWIRRCYVLVLPIPPPTYLKLFAYFIRNFTRSRIVALDSQCGFSIPGGPFSSASFVGKKNYIPAHVDTELYFEQANRLLSFLGYMPVNRMPRLDHVENVEVLKRFGLNASYIAMHICASGTDRSLPEDRWNEIIIELANKFPEILFVFTGTGKDIPFIQRATVGLSEKRLVIVTDVKMQELLTVYAHAKMCITVQTGNGHLINMMHLPAVTVNFKGIHMFRFSYNEKGTELYSEVGCTCHPLERKCSMVEYKGHEYMACLFNIPNEAVIKSVVAKYQP